MDRIWLRSVGLITGLLAGASFAMPQAYTVSAKPGAVNYIEGTAYINGAEITDKGSKKTFLNTGDTLSTDSGKVEVLLTPGVFLRMGSDSQVRIVAASLTDTQIEVNHGEAMIEAAGLLKDNNLQVLDHGSLTTIKKNGLYRFTGDNPPVAAVLDGKAEVRFGESKLDLGKGHEAVLSAYLKSQKLDKDKDDDLYAWSNVRSEYDAAASYSAAKSVAASSYAGYGGGYGNGFYNPGWFWNSGFDSWAWVPGNGAFYSPFGYGFYGPGLVGYAPVVIAPVGGRGPWNGHWNGHDGLKNAPVPVNANHPPAMGSAAASFSANQAVRMQTARSFSSSGFRTATGSPAASFSGGHAIAASPSSGGGGGFHSAAASGGGSHSGGMSSGGGGSHGGGMSSGGGGGSHGGGVHR